MPKPFNNLKVGQYILSETGSKAKVLAVHDLIFARSCWDMNLTTFQEWVSISDAQKKGWKVMEQGGRVPYKVEELERILGERIVIIPKEKKQ